MGAPVTIDDVPAPVLAGAIAAVAAVVTWAVRTTREANRVVTLDGKRVETIQAQAEYIAALEQKCRALQATIDTREIEYGEQLRKADARIAALQGDVEDLRQIVKQWRIVQDAQDSRAVRQEAREVHGASRDDADDKRQRARADRQEGRELAAEAREVAHEARASEAPQT